MLNIIQNTIGAFRRIGESVVRAGLKMWLPFTKADVGATNQTTPDISGNDNNAILKTGKCLTFTGNDSVQTAFPSSKDIKTIAFWIYPTHSSTDEVVFYFGDAAGGDKYIDLDHLVMESDANNNINFDVYIDGVLRGETNYGGNNPTLTINQWQRVVLTTDTAINTTNDKFYIAHRENGAFGRFNMSDLQIYGAEFTADDIAYDYANPQKLVTDNASSNVTLNDLHAWWHMSEGDGTIAFDSAPLLGVDVVPNGDFSTDNISAISGAGTRSVENNKLKIQEDGLGYSQCIYYGLLDTAKIYKVTFDFTIGTGSYIIYDTIDGPQSLTDGSGSYTAYLTNTARLYIGSNGAGDVWYLDNITAKEVYNIDGETYDGSSLGATYDDAQERIPQLGMMNWSKGSNVLTNSNVFGSSPWQYSGISLSGGYEAPDGTLTAYKVAKTQGTTSGILYDDTVSTNAGVIRSIWAKTVSGTGTIHLTSHNLNTNSLVTVTNEWQRFSIPSGVHVAYNFYAVDFRGSSTLTEVIIWGAQEEVNVGDSLSAFRKTDGTAVTDATLISCATDSQKDILGNAVRVKGSGFNLDGTGYGEVPHTTNFDFGTGDFSVSAWAKFSYTAKGSSFNAIYTNGGQVDATNTFALMSVNPNKIAVLVNTTSSISTSMFNNGEWVHIVATRNSGTISLYINGNKTPEDTNTNSDSVTSSQNPRIGYDGNNARFYENVIDDVQVYNRYLTPDEIEQNYNATKSGHNN